MGVTGSTKDIPKNYDLPNVCVPQVWQGWLECSSTNNCWSVLTGSLEKISQLSLQWHQFCLRGCKASFHTCNSLFQRLAMVCLLGLPSFTPVLIHRLPLAGLAVCYAQSCVKAQPGHTQCTAMIEGFLTPHHVRPWGKSTCWVSCIKDRWNKDCGNSALQQHKRNSKWMGHAPPQLPALLLLGFQKLDHSNMGIAVKPCWDIEGRKISCGVDSRHQKMLPSVPLHAGV